MNSCSKYEAQEYYEPMEVYYQRRCVKYIYVVPVGLRELMSDISREVLRSHPQHVYSFVADYLESLMVTRENIKVATRFVDDVTSTGQLIAELSKATNTSPKVLVAKVVIIQRYFRNYLRKKYFHEEDEESPSQMLLKCLGQLKVSRHKANLAAIIIQRAYRQYKEMIEKLESTPTNVVNWKLASRNTFSIFSKTKGVQFWELNIAATKIQAAYKGYYTRRKIRAFNEQQEEEELYNDRMSGILDFVPADEDQHRHSKKYNYQLPHEHTVDPVMFEFGQRAIDDVFSYNQSMALHSHVIEEEPSEAMTDYVRKMFDMQDKKETVEILALDTSQFVDMEEDNEDLERLFIEDEDIDIEDLTHNTRIDMQATSENLDDLGRKKSNQFSNVDVDAID